ncbi:MAG: hypothetical protein JW829_03905 [Pirellulales bacterium]|nr:hypothetical protein [Pirellulales bacterium]
MKDERRDSIRKYFAGLTEYAFECRLGIVDPPLVDYVAEMLARFIRIENIFSVRNPTGQRLVQVADMLQEAQFRHGAARRHIHRHIGDFTLFWSGIYPEIAERMRCQGKKDALIDYQAQGKRAYYIASTISVEKEYAPSELLHRLSEQFDMCVQGLAEVRRQWECERGDFGLAVLIN